MKSVKTYPISASNPYNNLAAEVSVEVSLSDVLVNEVMIEYVRTGKLPLPDTVVLSPYLAPSAGQFPSDSNRDLTSYTSRPHYDVGDKNILIVAFFCDLTGGDWSGERYTFTPVLFHSSGDSDVLSVCTPIRFDFTENTDDYGYRKWRNGTLYTVPMATRIIGGARYVKILCYQENHMWPWLGSDWDYGSPYSYFPNVNIGKLYVGAI